MNEFASTKELAALLGVCRETISHWQRDRKIPKSRRVGSKRLYRVAAVLEAVKKNRLNVDPVAASIIDNL